MSAQLQELRAVLAGRYGVERELGQGGMATVYLARDIKHNRQVAIKVLRPDLAAALGDERFLREIEIAANLNHPHILALFDSGSQDGFLYYVMPLVEGETLSGRVAREGAFPIPEVIRVFREMVDALAYAHGQGIVHRDIKPSNVMFTGRHVVVTDFGIAKAVSTASQGKDLTLTATGTAVGTPAYMSPEQAMAEADIDGRSDLYSAGVVAYELLTGQLPFDGTTAGAVIAAQLTKEATPISQLRNDVPADLERLVMQCLEREPGERWQTADEVLGYLEGMAAGADTPTRARARAVPKKAWKLPSRRNVALIGAALFGAVLVVIAAFSRGAPAPAARPAVPVTFSGDVRYMAMAGDGRTAAYVQAIGTGADRYDVLRIADVGGSGGDVPVVTGGQVFEPAWSADASTVMFYWRTPEARGIYEVPRLGGAPRRLINTEDWPPERGEYNYAGNDYLIGAGRWIYLGDDPQSIRWPQPDSMTGNGTLLKLFRVDEKGDTTGTGVRRGHGAGIALSPNGKWIAYAASGSIQIAASDGSGVTAWLGGPDIIGGGGSRMVWSPQSDGLFYLTIPEGQPGRVLTRMGVDPRTGEIDDAPTTVWRGQSMSRFDLRPDAGSMVFTELNRFSDLQLGRVNDGAVTDMEEFRTSTSYLLWPAFSQDGSRLVYSETVALGRSTIQIGAVDGGQGLSFPVSGVPSKFRWSPDGRQIAYHFETPSRENGIRLMVLDLETERFEDVSRIGAETGPAWSPDGRYLAYLNFRKDSVNFLTLADNSIRSLPLDGIRGRSVLFSAGSDSLVIQASRRVNGTVEHGLWLTSIEELRPVRLDVERIGKLLQWQGGHIYFQAADRFLRIALDGSAPEVFATLDEACSGIGLNTLAPDLITVICASTIDRTDLMIVQGFDAN